MQLKLYIILISILSVIHVIHAKRSSRRSKWVSDLVNCISRNFSQHQALIMVEKEYSEGSTIIEDVIKQISQHIPTKVFDYEEVYELGEMREGQLLKAPFSGVATLFITFLISSDAFTRLKPIMSYEDYHVRNEPPCKYLILLPNEIEDLPPVTILKELWEANIARKKLDVSIVQIKRRSVKTNNHFLNQKEEDAIVHIYNPLNQIYKQEKLTSESILFPEKVRNLYNYDLKFYFDNPNQKALGEALAQALQFPLNFPSCRDTRDCVNSFYNYSLGNDSMELGENFVPAVYYKEGMVSGTEPTDRVGLYAVIPVLQNQNLEIRISTAFVWTIFATILGILFIRILAKVLKFEGRNWCLMNIIQMILGVSLPEEPRRLVERIVFATIMLTWVIYSGYLHSVLTTIGVYQESNDVDNFEELIKSRFVPYMTFDLQSSLTFDEDNDTGGFFENYKELKEPNPDRVGATPICTECICIQYLLEYKNVSCYMKKKDFVHFNSQYAKIKRLKQPVLTYFVLYLVREGSPITRAMNQVFSRLTESGLLKKLRETVSDVNNFEYDDLEEVQQTLELWKIVACILFYGYSLSIIAFIAEVIIGWLCKKKSASPGIIVK